ncbi:aminotransferase class I/II-fold pyridoxal phosphate-dependent enzyme [Heliobacterium gestii]|uniref:Aminotransferase n=1 Tax=Heliomicrobium gestii TaxID=2699 RepID=A0A845LAS1_HELGE|nr:LL-diaminopimelate aminotransferase [Heliomicrobium gestii]MBM7867197.1 LL-diaminopimelate aminotransferase [Heliomicrobium gestii]MZP43752.1 aminotransferase class I/II-fold pyridoxal phosphate-dependent enzyme [Heliomicrobium gestii]
MFDWKPARRMANLSSAMFSRMDALRQEVEGGGVDVINLGIGSPDRPPAPHVRQALMDGLARDDAFGYALTDGLMEFKSAVADWYQQRFGVTLDPKTEVLSLMGSQDGLGHLGLALLDPGDITLVPDPGYPIYSAGVLLAEGVPYPLPLEREKNYLPDFDAIPEEVLQRAKLMILNYPSNPMAATAELEFFARVVDFARRNSIIVLHDVAYSELAYDGYRPVSFLQAPGAKEVGIEFHSVSKSYNLAGCRLGMAVGNREVLAVLANLKSNIDYGVFKAVQWAAVAALRGPQAMVEENAKAYQRRRDVLVDGLARIGWQMDKPKASMFVWAPVPEGFASSFAFAEELLRETGVLVVPGNAFGERGEGYVRIALVVSEERLAEAVDRIAKRYRFAG